MFITRHLRWWNWAFSVFLCAFCECTLYFGKLRAALGLKYGFGTKIHQIYQTNFERFEIYQTRAGLDDSLTNIHLFCIWSVLKFSANEPMATATGGQREAVHTFFHSHSLFLFTGHVKLHYTTTLHYWKVTSKWYLWQQSERKSGNHLLPLQNVCRSPLEAAIGGSFTPSLNTYPLTKNATKLMFTKNSKIKYYNICKARFRFLKHYLHIT